MQRRTNDPRRVVEEPRRSLFPYVAVAIVAAVTVWGIAQETFQDSTPAPRSSTEASQTTGSGRQASRGDVRTVFSPDDYPADAQRNGEEGTVQAELSIDRHGAVAGCRILRSSGHASLDSATCNILRRRARFSPARDVNGDAVPSTLTTPPVVWRLEG